MMKIVNLVSFLFLHLVSSLTHLHLISYQCITGVKKESSESLSDDKPKGGRRPRQSKRRM